MKLIFLLERWKRSNHVSFCSRLKKRVAQKSNGRDANRNQLVLFNLERDCSNIETKLFNLVRFLMFYGFCVLVGFIRLLMLDGIVCVVLDLSILIDALNK